MKTNRLTALLVVIFLGCSKPEPAQLTPQEQEAVKKDEAPRYCRTAVGRLDSQRMVVMVTNEVVGEISIC